MLYSQGFDLRPLCFSMKYSDDNSPPPHDREPIGDERDGGPHHLYYALSGSRCALNARLDAVHDLLC